MSTGTIAKCVSYMNETVHMFSGKTVRDNICLGRKSVMDEDYEQAVRMADVEVAQDKVIGDAAFNLSSGEERRIEIARSLASETGFMIFDEVLSTLDVETAYELEKMTLGFENTVVVISHNFSGRLIREYDEILIMDGGKLVAHGPYDELLRTDDYFKRICDIKFGIAS